MSKLASFLNDVNTRSVGIGKLSDLRTGYSYEVKQFERINTKFGDAIVAHLHYIGPTMDYPTRIFLPRRFAAVITDEMVEDYQQSKKKLLIMYKGFNNGRYDIEFK
uniref:Uncharacterized protein n=2 Tax=Rhodnius prolixus TaxID=13249 RepID=T1HVZ8_RHOPR